MTTKHPVSGDATLENEDFRDDFYSISELLNFLRSWQRLLLGAGTLGIICGFTVSYLRPPSYKSEFETPVTTPLTSADANANMANDILGNALENPHNVDTFAHAFFNGLSEGSTEAPSASLALSYFTKAFAGLDHFDKNPNSSLQDRAIVGFKTFVQGSLTGYVHTGKIPWGNRLGMFAAQTPEGDWHIVVNAEEKGVSQAAAAALLFAFDDLSAQINKKTAATDRKIADKQLNRIQSITQMALSELEGTEDQARRKSIAILAKLYQLSGTIDPQDSAELSAKRADALSGYVPGRPLDQAEIAEDAIIKKLAVARAAGKLDDAKLNAVLNQLAAIRKERSQMALSLAVAQTTVAGATQQLGKLHLDHLTPAESADTAAVSSDEKAGQLGGETALTSLTIDQSARSPWPAAFLGALVFLAGALAFAFSRYRLQPRQHGGPRNAT